MVKKRKKKNAITLLALVITIVIMLLLAGVAIQMTMGENGLIAKSVQAQKEQAKAELYDTAKLSYMSLNAKALENGQPSPQVELALSTTEFRDRYDIVGDDITDKKGTVIDTKANVLNIIQGTVAGGFTAGTTTPAESWPKTVAGVTIPEEEKNDMIIKLKVIGAKAKIDFFRLFRNDGKIIDYGTGNHTETVNGVEFYNGEHIIKISKFKSLEFIDEKEGDYEFEILQWGKIAEKNQEDSIGIPNVSKVYEPEPDRVQIIYANAKFTEIPEWLFSKKVTSKYMSGFNGCTSLTSIPEGLFKNNVNVTNFREIFEGCTGLTSIPEGLFKNNVNVKDFNEMFKGCTGLTSIPEGLFENNVNVIGFGSTFYGCTGLTSIPEGLFKNNVNATNFNDIFTGCTGLTNIPEGLFENNVNVKNFSGTFGGCTGLTSIPEGLFKNNVNTTDFWNTFKGCTGLTSIPEGLFKYNVNVTEFWTTFGGCTGLANIPEGLFKYNVNTKKFSEMFKGCAGLTSIPEKIIELGKKVKEKGGNVSLMFYGCTSASNYNSIPNYMKQY